MKLLLPVIALLICTATFSFAEDVYGCIINERSSPVAGTISSGIYSIRFNVQGEYVWCYKLPEGQYSILTDNGKINETFSALWQRSIGHVGDETLHWLVKIKE
ncbi:hypothetical protein [Maridesulfovibrio hydrothermalis]|uniref:Carboxypeptidase regulatory-like domain-containing protein n=1 Tax=Maridesulfovibrio hydrothermalis AM13 = DSM 14728 TaxID=1121451 RepID=L0RBN0_9BACT|nr:hypothetical protein [Maridesulfovibrio hydrothermalis]CCO24198.1 exported protein of unknown function [Maridesulfovibrio hydrothermalis AM13 = DSM 14728]